MIYTDLLRSIQFEPGVASLMIGDDWLQGRSAFGGLQVALAVAAMRTLVAPDMPLKTLQTLFLAPVPSGTVTAQAQVLRVGKSVTHVEARLLLGDQQLAVVLGVFGRPRVSDIARAPVLPAVDASRPVVLPPATDGVVPSFTQHFHARWISGGLPFAGHPSPASVVLLDMLDNGPMTEAHVIAIADFIPPVALSMLSKPTAGSSMTWMLELVRESYAGLGLDGWRIDAEMVAAYAGYTSQSALIFAPDGELAAISRQSMVVFG